MVRKGFDGFSMQKLAKAANVSPATLYIYFKDREDLILSIYAEVNQRMTDATLKNFNPDMHFEEGLKIQWINRARHSLQHAEEMQLLEQIRFSPLYEKALATTDPGFKKSMMQFIKNAIQRKEIVQIPFEVYWSIAYAPLYNLIKFHFTGRKKNGEKFTFNDAVMLDTLKLIIKALQP